MTSQVAQMLSTRLIRPRGTLVTYHVKLTRPELWQQLLDHVATYLTPGRELTPTLHAQEQAERRGLLLPTVLPEEFVVVEVSPGKCLLRMPYYSGWLCMSINEAGNIVTAYHNAGDDDHATLDSTKYVVGST